MYLAGTRRASRMQSFKLDFPTGRSRRTEEEVFDRPLILLQASAPLSKSTPVVSGPRGNTHYQAHPPP